MDLMHFTLERCISLLIILLEVGAKNYFQKLIDYVLIIWFR